MPDQLPSVLILGIDPSSGVDTSRSVTGLALLRVSLSGRPVLVGHAACFPQTKHDDPITKRVLRLAETSEDVYAWVSSFGTVDAIGYEQPYMDPQRKNWTYEALCMACGAILCQVPLKLDGGKVYAIHAGTAKAIYNAGGKPREEAKALCMAWAKQSYHLPEMDAVSLEAIADALAVAEVAVSKWREDHHLQRALFGKGSGKAVAR